MASLSPTKASHSLNFRALLRQFLSPDTSPQALKEDFVSLKRIEIILFLHIFQNHQFYSRLLQPARTRTGCQKAERDFTKCIDLGLGANEEQVESLWVRIKGQAHTSDITVGVYYRPPDQEEEVDEAFYRQLQAASQSQALVLMGDFNHPDISWEDHTARQA